MSLGKLRRAMLVLACVALSSVADADAGVADPADLAKVVPDVALVGFDQTLLRHMDTRTPVVSARGWSSELGGGYRAEWSVDPALQTFSQGLLDRYQVPRGAIVALDPHTGRVLAFVSRSRAGADGPVMALDAEAPAASTFKVITATALLEAGVPPTTAVCFHDGSQRLVEDNLQDDPKRDHECASLSTAMGQSLNPVFAKLALKHLTPKVLARCARAFGYGAALPFDVTPQTSQIEVPEDTLEFARTAAGFWHSHLSAVHGALIAATVARGGRMPTGSLVARVVDETGRVVYSAPRSRESVEVMAPRTAKALTAMMETTVTHGTSTSAFYENGRPVLRDVHVAGKTGTLNRQEPFAAYSWWIGFAPVEKPRIALAALVINDPLWRIKASFVAREVIRTFLGVQQRGQVKRARRSE